MLIFYYVANKAIQAIFPHTINACIQQKQFLIGPITGSMIQPQKKKKAIQNCVFDHWNPDGYFSELATLPNSIKVTNDNVECT